jgi:WD40 repeat protein
MWYLNNGSLKTTLTGHKKAVNCILNVGNSIVVSGSADHTVKVWSVHNSSLLFDFDNKTGGHTDEVSSLAFINFDLIASASWDKTVKVWDLTTFSLKFTFDNTNGGHTGKVNCLSLLKNGLLASGSSDSSVKVWDPINGTLMFNFNSTNGGYSSSIVQLLSFSSEILVANANENILKAWDLNSTNNSLINSFDTSINDTLGHFTAIEATDNPLLVAGLSYGGIKVWDPIYGILFHIFDGTYGYNSSIDLLCAIHSGLFAAANGLNEIRVYDTYFGLEMFKLTGHTDSITSMIVAHNGDLISGSLDGTIRVWSMATRLAKYVFNNQNEGHTGSVTALAAI